MEWQQVKITIDAQYIDTVMGALIMAGITGFEIEDPREFDDNLMSLKVKNAYATGEALDIDGDSGGYNLQWAFSSAKAVASAILKNRF